MSKKVKEVSVVEEVVVEEVVKPSLKIMKLDGTDAGLAYQTSLSAGLDLTISENVTVYKGADPIVVKTGLRLENTGVEGVFGLLSLRSSQRKRGLSIMGVGIIDLDYKGEIVIPIVYLGSKTGVKLSVGERLAQIVFIPFIKSDNEVIEKERGEGGFGST